MEQWWFQLWDPLGKTAWSSSNSILHILFSFCCCRQCFCVTVRLVTETWLLWDGQNFFFYIIIIMIIVFITFNFSPVANSLVRKAQDTFFCGAVVKLVERYEVRAQTKIFLTDWAAFLLLAWTYCLSMDWLSVMTVHVGFFFISPVHLNFLSECSKIWLIWGHISPFFLLLMSDISIFYKYI